MSPPVVCIDMIRPFILSGRFLLSGSTLLPSPYKQCPHFVFLLWPASTPPPQFPKPCLFSCIVCILLHIAFLFWSTQSTRQKLEFLLDSFCVQPSTRAPVFCSILLHSGNMLNQRGRERQHGRRGSLPLSCILLIAKKAPKLLLCFFCFPSYSPDYTLHGRSSLPR